MTTEIQELVRIHDDQPQQVAAALREMARDQAVPAADRVQFAWLVNHVIGEKEGAWREALALQQQALGAPDAIPLLLHRAAAALHSGAVIDAWILQSKLVREHGTTDAQARSAVQLRALQFSEKAPVADVAAALCDALRGLSGVSEGGKLAAAIATPLNNTVSRIVDAEEASPDNPAVREALVEGGEAARRFWREAGDWMNHERADYLVALCRNKVGDWDAARAAAQSGLDTIAANGVEDVDRAFLLLELARAWRGLGDEAKREAARAEAMKIAESFDDAGLRKWFDDCAAR